MGLGRGSSPICQGTRRRRGDWRGWPRGGSGRHRGRGRGQEGGGDLALRQEPLQRRGIRRRRRGARGQMGASRQRRGRGCIPGLSRRLERDNRRRRRGLDHGQVVERGGRGGGRGRGRSRSPQGKGSRGVRAGSTRSTCRSPQGLRFFGSGRATCIAAGAGTRGRNGDGAPYAQLRQEALGVSGQEERVECRRRVCHLTAAREAARPQLARRQVSRVTQELGSHAALTSHAGIPRVSLDSAPRLLPLQLSQATSPQALRSKKQGGGQHSSSDRGQS